MHELSAPSKMVSTESKLLTRILLLIQTSYRKEAAPTLFVRKGKISPI